MKITISNLMKSFNGTVAVNIQDLTIEDGEIVGLVGNNGAGKTTLMRLILDLLGKDSGEVRLNGELVNESEDWKEITGSFIDYGFLIDFLTPEEFFAFVGKSYGLSKEEVTERLVLFEPFMNNEILAKKKYIRAFSAGNKQKIGIISAMISHPEFVILDEPFNFLDPSSQVEIKELLRTFHGRYNSTILISSHNLEHITDVSGRVILLENGKVFKDVANETGDAIKELNEYFHITHVAEN